MKDIENYSLLAHNTFGIEARCSRFLEYESQEEARHVAALLRSDKRPLLIIGGGSNLLLTKDFDGVVVHSALKGIEAVPCEQGCCVSCGSGEVWDDVVVYCVEHGLQGMENLSLIPGDVGASAVQNIGAYGAEAKDLITAIEAVEIATGEVRRFSNAECEYAYRQSKFKHAWKDRFLITRVIYRLNPVGSYTLNLDYGNIRAELERRCIGHPTLAELRQVVIDIRNAKLPDPKTEGNAGSFFMNPVVSRAEYEQLAAAYPGMPHYAVDEGHEKIPAGWMIEQCGWKGRTLGRAGVHAKQALVLVNRGGATGGEIVELCRAVQRDVWNKFGVEIRPEVNVV
jgi:UDP-N-acetylmuramate dehydrogenase